MTSLVIGQKNIAVRMELYVVIEFTQHSQTEQSVVIQQLQIFAATVVKGILKIKMGIYRFSQAKILNLAGICGTETRHQRRSVIRRCIVRNDNFNLVRFLKQRFRNNRIQCLAKVRTAVESRNTNGKKWITHRQ